MKRVWIGSCVGLTAIAAVLTLPRVRSSHPRPAESIARAVQVRNSPGLPAKLEAQNVGSTPSVHAKPSAHRTSPPQVPLEFEANRGQAAADFGFVAHGPAYALGLSATDIALSLHRPHEDGQAKPGSSSAEETMQPMDSARIDLRLVGASANASIAGAQPKSGVSNYFIGSDPARWQTGVPHFGQVEIAKTYPGIDLVFYGNPQQLEYDFRIAPGADPGAIRLEATGATSASLDKGGNLVLGTAAGEVQLKHPEAYQEIAGVRKPVRSGFRLIANNAVAFKIGQYDHSQPLVVDPVLLYGVSFGGSNGNEGIGLDVDAAGNAYSTGNTCSSDFPSTAGNFGKMTSSVAVAYCQDVYVTKIDPTASTLIYSDYIGGSIAQTGASIAIDSAGNAYVTGTTGSSDFPLVNNIGPASLVPCGLSKTAFNCAAGFIFKLSPDGSQLLFSSLLGGSQTAGGVRAKINPVTGDLLVMGITNSSDFKPAATTLQTSYSGGTCPTGIPCYNSFLLGLNSTTGALKYGTLFGSAQYVVLLGLSFDSAGDIYVTGSSSGTLASSLGTVTQTYAPAGAAAGGSDVLVARLHLAGSTLSTTYMTLIQGELDDSGGDIALDSSGNAYVVGSTASLHLPVTSNAFQSTNTNTGGNLCFSQTLAVEQFLPVACGTGLVAKLNSGGALTFLTYLGGNNQTLGEGIAVDSSGNIWLTGITTASNFPYSADAYDLSSLGFAGGFNTPFLAEMSNNGSTLPFATQVGIGPGQSTGIKIDSNSNVYVTGYTSVALTTPNVYPADPEAYNPVFVQKWGTGSQPALQLSSNSLIFASTPYGGVTPAQTVTAKNTGTGPMELSVQLATTSYDATVPPGFLESDNCGASLAAGASCTIALTFEPALPTPSCTTQSTCNSGVVVVQTNAAAGAQTIRLAGTAGRGAAVGVIPNPIVFPPQAAGTVSSPMDIAVGSYGDLGLSISNAAITGANASEFQISSIGTCSAPVASGLIGCDLDIVFSPSASATGTRTASLVLTDNAGDSPQTIPITGTVATTGASLIVSTNTTFLGPAAIGATTAGTQANITLTNTSTNTDVQVTSLTVGGANSADFTTGSGSCSLNSPPFTIAKGTSCFAVVHFSPASGTHGLRTATVTLATNPAVSGLPVLTFTGDALTNTDTSLSYISVPTPQDFGSQQIGQPSYAGQNLLALSAAAPIPCAGGATTCGGALTITSFVVGNSDFTVSIPQPYSYCTNPPLTLPAGNYGCQFQIVFTPTAAGNRNTTLTINTNDPMGPTVIPLYGAGLALPLSNLSVNDLDFGYSAIGAASPPLTVTLRNAGQGSLSVPAVTTTANYSVASNTCTVALAPNATCTIGVAFTPPSAGSFPGTLTITNNDYFSAQQTVALSGIGAAGPALRLSATSFNFGNQAVNTASVTQTLTLTNSSDTVITFPANAFRASMDYLVQGTTCGASLAQGASCTVSLQFKPSSVTAFDGGSLLITDNARGNPQQIALVGVGATSGGTPAVTLTSSLNPSALGQAVTFSATVAGTAGGAPVPTGTVAFYDYVTPLGAGTLNGSGQASVTTSALSTGTNTINAIYSGDANYPSTSSVVLTQVVNPASGTATTTTLVSSVNPSTSGQSVIFTATVAGVGSNTPTPSGTVTFLDGSTTLGTATLNGGAQAVFTSPSLSTGSHSITAVFAGTGTYAASTSTALSQVVNAGAKTSTTTSLSSSANPATVAQSVVFTATVAGVGSNTPVPTGTVTFLSGSTTLGTGTLNGSGQASFTTTTLALGSHGITAVYNADTNYATSTSAALTEVINAAAKTSTTTTLSSSANPATVAQSVVFTATVAGVGSNTPVPTGTVTFLDGSTTLGPGTLGSGTATFTTATLAAGSHSITAQYAGDTNYSPSTSSALTQAVNAVASGFTVGFSPTTLTVTRGQSGATTLTVTPVGGFSQAVGFACSGLPQFTTCAFSPVTVTPTGSTAATSTLTIATNAGVASNDSQPGQRSPAGRVLSAALVLEIGLLATSRMRKRMAGRMFWRAALLLGFAALSAIVTLQLTGCGGGSKSGSSGGSSTPTGSSTITVTATGGSQVQTGSFTLTVQ